MYTLDICFEDITREVKKNHKVTNKGLIKSAYDYATKKHKNQKPRKTGEPYIMHPLRVAYLVASWGFEADTICAALLHDTLEDTDATYNELVSIIIFFRIYIIIDILAPFIYTGKTIKIPFFRR